MKRPLIGLSWNNAFSESIAGVTLLAIAVPLNIGYAQIAGLPPTAGLYALVFPAVVYALCVSSRQLVASPDAAAAALVASSIGGLAIAGSSNYLVMAFAQAIISGVLFIFAAAFKLGFLANFLSKPILIGFVGGLALDILISQIAKMLGVKIDSGEFIQKISDLVTTIDSLNWWSMLISAAAILVLVAGRRIARAVPWALIVLIGATVIVVSTGLENAGVAVLGPIDAGLPTLSWPVLDWKTWLSLVPSAIALTLVTTAEGLLVARSYGEKHQYTSSPNRDLFAFGAANITAGATGGFSVGSSTSRTAAMDQAGSRTQLPTIVAAIGTLLLLLFGTSLLEHVPSPAIGAIVGIAIIPLLGIREFRELWKKDRFEFIVGAVCFLATLLIGAIPGILIAFVLALVNLARRASTPAIDVLAANDNPDASLLDPAPAGAPTAPGVLVIRLAAPLFFANGTVFSDAVKRAVTTSRDIRYVVLDLEAVTDIDVTGAEAFVALKLWLKENSITLAFSRPRGVIASRMRTLELLEDEVLYPTNRAAITSLTTPQSPTTKW